MQPISATSTPSRVEQQQQQPSLKSQAQASADCHCLARGEREKDNKRKNPLNTKYNMHTNLLPLLLLLLLPAPSHGYIPAQPSNQTAPPTDSDSNWIVQLNWLPIGIFSDGITHQLTSEPANRSIYQGVLLHFSELNATTQPPAVVPWIAMINCDSNSSTFSTQDDIFTLARDRGAAAAMLYSSTSHSCQVNQDYIQNFEKPLDVFSAGSLQGARLIESQFSNVLRAGYWFQSDLLNASASTILQQIKSLGLSNLTATPTTTTLSTAAAPLQTNTNQPDPRSASTESADDQPLTRRSPIDDASSYNSLHQSLITRSSHPSSPDQTFHLKFNLNSSTHHPTSVNAGNNPVFLIATLANAQVTGNLDPHRQSRNQNSNFQSNTNGANNNPNTGLAMIILYAITGCVSFMFRFLLCIYAIACLPLPLLVSTNFGRFLIVIVSGAIRAIRNPDRYGPRPGGRVDPQTGEEDPYAQPRQTRAEGLGKAILDTFPIVKFGRQNSPVVNKEDSESVKHNPITSTPKELKLALGENIVLPPGQENIIASERGQRDEQPPSTNPPIPTTNTGDKLPNQNQGQPHDDDEGGSVASDTGPYPLLASQVPLLSQPHLSSSSSSPKKIVDFKTESRRISNHTDQEVSDLKHKNDDNNQELSPTKLPHPKTKTNDHVNDVDVDKEEGKKVDLTTTTVVNNSTTCPICVSEFEEDDDIRMLPCDARHQFHKECVDPWLLNESKFCPLCRWDLSTRKDGSKIETTQEILSSEVEVEPTSPTLNQSQGDGEGEGGGEIESRRMRLSWLMLRNRTSHHGNNDPSFSIPLPLIRRRRRASSTLDHHQFTQPNLVPSSSSSSHVPVDPPSNLSHHLAITPPSDLVLNTSTTSTNSHNTNITHHQEIVDSHNRFLRYIHHIRHLKK